MKNVKHTTYRYLVEPFAILLLLVMAVKVQAQCPSPIATTAPINASNSSIGSYTTVIGSNSVTYVTGNIVLGTNTNAYSMNVSSNTTVVITAGSHLTLTNLSVSGKLIIQAGASVSVVGLTNSNGILGVNAGGIIQMCESSGIENCGNTTFTPFPSIEYVGGASGKAVVKANYKVGTSGPIVGTLSMPSSAPGVTTSSNITIATPPTSPNLSVTGSVGTASTCTIGSNCTSLPFPVTTTCGEFAIVCNAGTTAPILSATTKGNACPATTIDLTTITATNTPVGITLTFHTGTPATAANQVKAGNPVTDPTAVPAGTYYAAFYDATNNCYSGTAGSATTIITATSTSCTPPVAGQCVNILTNPSFESPVQPNVNANNTIIGLTFNGWTASANTSANPFNIIKVDATGYSVGPDKAADGIQYLDIVGSAIVTQTFTVPTGGAFVKYSGSYANRETSGGYSPSYNYITLLNSSGTIVGTSSAVDLIASIGEEKWFSVFGFTGTRLPAGTYTYKVVIGNFTHFDNASVCLQTEAPAGTIDCAKTQISSAPVFGTAGQKTLSVTTNITTAGCFGPLIVSGSGMSLPDGFTQLCTNTTGIQTFSIPVNYDGSALSTMSFTLGALGTCTADLTKAPKKAICDIWTLECVPTAAPSLK